MRVLAIIPARGGSKGIPRKNVRLLCGKPLLEYTVTTARQARRLSRVILSTEDEEIAYLGRRLGVEVPFIRPVELAQDDTPMLPVVIHAVETLEREGGFFDAVCILQPTHPLRTAKDIDTCIELLETSQATAVITVLSVPAKYNPHWVYFRDDKGYLRLSTGEAEPIPRRQLLPPAYHREGSVYVVRREVLMASRSLYGDRVLGVTVSAERSINIDTWDDWIKAERLLEGGD